MIKSRINLLFVTGLTLILVFLAGCSENTEPDIAKTSEDNQTQTTLNTNTSVNNDISDNSPKKPTENNVDNPPAVSVDNNSDKPSGEKQSSNSTVKAPAPVIGSGGNDLALFTQVRGALNAEQEFINIIIDVKEGNVVLNGNVANKEQKAKAEQIAQKVKGVKSVKNNLTVSS